MSMHTILYSQAATVIEKLGEPVTYVTQTGVRNSINAVIGLQYDEFGASRVGDKSRQISIVKADAPRITRGEQIITAESVAYQVEDILEDDGYVVRVSAARV